ncbi:uncharacterized protein LOC108233803 [Kryptolebias marmoratus]|uniref:Uncharacterized LOC108233803 n=1 Tax=Kryptolebias marmoratus TaxID=37003 RepID=A0A3Q3AD75_KRYMA|nr:uncharacterized protein LOC108233803 [Kryptolebias marmoratus]
MGRRAADPMTPVPVLGVPALVGVRSWKTIEGEKGGRALLQTWGLCSVGVQTSPGIRRPPAQQPDTLSNNVIQTSNSCITKETEDTLQLTKNNNEKRAILGQKTGETKIRKEVTFKAPRGDASKDDETYCYARRINTDPFIAGTLTSSRTKLKLATRYMNGSVVDSEAIGGISVVNDEAEPVKGAASHGRDHHNADQLAKMIPLTASHSLAMPREICNSCGGKRSETCKATILGENSLTPGACITEKTLKPALTSLFTTTHFQVPYIHTKLQQNQQISQSNSDKMITVNPKVLYLNEELRYRKTPHPACPVHSRGNLANPHVPSDGTSDQPATILHAKSSTVTKATIEHLAKPLQDNKIPLLASFTLTPQATTATKPNNPHPHTYPKLLKTTHLKLAHNNVPQNICVSMHATTENARSPPPSYMYTIAMKSRQTFCANTYKTHTTFNTKMMPSDSDYNAKQETLRSIHKTQIRNVTNTTNITQVAPKCLTLSLSTNALKSNHPACLTSPQPNLSELQEKKPPSSTVSPAAGKMAFIDQEVSSVQLPTLTNPPNTTASHSLLSTSVTQSTLNHKANSDQITQTSTKLPSVAAQICSAPTNCSIPKPTLQIFASSLHKTSNASQIPDFKSILPATYTSRTTCSGAPGKNIACGSIKFHLKKNPGSLLSPVTKRQNNVCGSSMSSLQLTDTTKVLNYNEAPDTSKAHHTEVTDSRHQGSNERSVWDVISNQESNSRTTLLTPSKPQNVSGNHNKGRDTKSTINPNVCSDKNKFKHDLINKLIINESKDHENSNCSQVTNTLNYISLIKSRESSLQACLNPEQQSLAYYQGCTETSCVGPCATSPPVKTDTDSNAHQFPLGATANHANGKLKSNADRQTDPSVSQPSVTTQTNCEPTVSHGNTQVRRNTSSPACQNSNFLITLQKQAHRTLEHSVTVPASISGEGELCADAGPECESILLSSTMPLASRVHIQPSEVEANSRAYSKFCPGVPQSSTDDTSLAHSHPADAALLLPPSPQCCKSAALEQRLKAVEANLAANKDRITTLLNIIHDLETISTPSSHRRCCKTGLDLKNCSTCQKTACIVYSVEYDFRRQERNFLEVLNQSGGGSKAFPAHLTQPLNISLLRNVIIKNLTKTKLKSKKLCKTLLKWLPRKIQQL